MYFPGDNAGLGYNFQRPQDMNCPCDVCHCGKPRRRRKRNQHEAPEIYEAPKFEPCVHRYFKTDPIVRECLTREQYIDMLAAPKVHPWLGEVDHNNYGSNGKKSKKNKLKKRREEETAKQELRCTDFSFAEEFINDMWDVMSPDVTDRLIDFLVNEFGMSVEEAEDFIDCKSSVGKPTPCVKKQSKAIISLGPKHKWVKKLSEVFANRIEQYIVSMLMARKTPRIKRVAERVLHDMCDITGDKTSMQYPKTKREKTMVLIATRLAFWVDDIMKDLDKPRKERPPVSEEEESEIEEEPEDKGEKEEEEEEEEEEDKEKLPPGEERAKEKEAEKPVKKPGEEEAQLGEQPQAEEEAPTEEEKPTEEVVEEEVPTEEEKPPVEEPVEEIPTEEVKVAEEEEPPVTEEVPEPPAEEAVKEQEPPEEETVKEEVPAVEEVVTAEEEKPIEPEAEPPAEEIPEEVPTEEPVPRLEKDEEPEETELAEEAPGEEGEEEEEIPIEEKVEPAEAAEEGEVKVAEIPEEEEISEKEPEKYIPAPVPKKSPIVTPRKPAIPAFEVRAKTGSTLQVQKLSSGTVVERTAQARGVPVPPRRKVPASESPLNMKSAEEWVDWAKNIANIADEWGNWLENRFTDAEKQLSEKRKLSEWKAWMDKAQIEALKWRVEEERIKDEGEMWGKKLDKQSKGQPERIVKTTDLS